jgi:hypothetical protein
MGRFMKKKIGKTNQVQWSLDGREAGIFELGLIYWDGRSHWAFYFSFRCVGGVRWAVPCLPSHYNFYN